MIGFNLDLGHDKRKEILEKIINKIDSYYRNLDKLPVAPKLNLDEIQSYVRSIGFDVPNEPDVIIERTVEGMTKYQVHTTHPMYYGLFNPRTTPMGIAADALAAAFNSQLAAWSHNPFGCEVENYLINEIACRFGYDSGSADGTFTTGGAEANITSILCALTHFYPEYPNKGICSIKSKPVLYMTEQSHHSFIRAARVSGLGSDAIRIIPVADELKIDIEALQEQINIDRKNGCQPMFLTATAGTTGAGTIDRIDRLSEIADREKMWFHVDAAYGGALIFVKEMMKYYTGIEKSDSTTFDAHKWMNAPMGAGIFLTRHKKILHNTFNIMTNYMPTDSAGLAVDDPYSHSIQWSRRFIGLKVFMNLAAAGWEGYRQAVNHQINMGNLLRELLIKSGWEIVNSTPLPVVCFRDKMKKSDDEIISICNHVVSSGKAWLSFVKLADSLPALRACVTNYMTEEKHILALVDILNKARG